MTAALESIKTARFLRKALDWLWVAALLSLPVTSFPLLVKLTGAVVTPLAGLPIMVIFLVWLIPYLLRRGAIPKETVSFICFVIIAIIASTAAFFHELPSYKGKTILAQELRSLFTLGIGLSFYLVFAAFPASSARLTSTLRWIHIGGMLALGWAAIQAYFILTHAAQYPAWMKTVQEWLVLPSPAFSVRDGRVNGLTYEASWFAHQMVMLYLPLWFAATYQKTSVFKLCIFRISVENILLVFGVIAFFMASPRIGLISFLLMLLFLFLKFNLALHRQLTSGLFRRLGLLHKASRALQTMLSILILLLIAAGYVAILAGLIFLASQRDSRLALLIENPPDQKEIVGLLTLDPTTLLLFSHRLVFMERMIYWLSGWNVFNLYPWLGVGLGNAGFLFPQTAPSAGWGTYEIRSVLYYMASLPNTKSYWMRLLAETGLVGFSVFLTWLYVLMHSARLSLRSRVPQVRLVALAGQLALFAFIGEGFSIDSFAMPYLWVMVGLLSASGMLGRKEFHA